MAGEELSHPPPALGLGVDTSFDLKQRLLQFERIGSVPGRRLRYKLLLSFAPFDGPNDAVLASARKPTIWREKGNDMPIQDLVLLCLAGGSGLGVFVMCGGGVFTPEQRTTATVQRLGTLLPDPRAPPRRRSHRTPVSSPREAWGPTASAAIRAETGARCRPTAPGRLPR